jgi:hypothetical protein
MAWKSNEKAYRTGENRMSEPNSPEWWVCWCGEQGYTYVSRDIHRKMHNAEQEVA